MPTPLFVQQLSELIDTLRLTGRLHIVASSLGALVAMGYLIDHPKRVASVTFSGPA